MAVIKLFHQTSFPSPSSIHLSWYSWHCIPSRSQLLVSAKSKQKIHIKKEFHFWSTSSVLTVAPSRSQEGSGCSVVPRWLHCVRGESPGDLGRARHEPARKALVGNSEPAMIWCGDNDSGFPEAIFAAGDSECWLQLEVCGTHSSTGKWQYSWEEMIALNFTVRNLKGKEVQFTISFQRALLFFWVK